MLHAKRSPIATAVVADSAAAATAAAAAGRATATLRCAGRAAEGSMFRRGAQTRAFGGQPALPRTMAAMSLKELKRAPSW